MSYGVIPAGASLLDSIGHGRNSARAIRPPAAAERKVFSLADEDERADETQSLLGAKVRLAAPCSLGACTHLIMLACRARRVQDGGCMSQIRQHCMLWGGSVPTVGSSNGTPLPLNGPAPEGFHRSAVQSENPPCTSWCLLASLHRFGCSAVPSCTAYVNVCVRMRMDGARRGPRLANQAPAASAPSRPAAPSRQGTQATRAWTMKRLRTSCTARSKRNAQRLMRWGTRSQSGASAS